MDILWQELSFGFGDRQQLVRVLIRLLAAVLLGAVIGYEREKAGKAAGLRTHILVTLGTSVFVLACSGYGMSSDGLSRVIQGIVTGIGFIGAGSILKIDNERNIQGLTSSAGIWMTAAIGVSVGLGEIGLAIFGTIAAVIVLALLGTLDIKPENKDKAVSGNA
jgi:putative Mg2+ transporter-C (MgtC) family protein